MEEKANGYVPSSIFTTINVISSLLVLLVSSYIRYLFYPILTLLDMGRQPKVTELVFLQIGTFL